MIISFIRVSWADISRINLACFLMSGKTTDARKNTLTCTLKKRDTETILYSYKTNFKKVEEM